MEDVDAELLSYAAFCARFLATNTPVKLRNITRQWFATAMTQWTATAAIADGDGERQSIDFDALKTNYGHAMVPVRCVLLLLGMDSQAIDHS